MPWWISLMGELELGYKGADFDSVMLAEQANKRASHPGMCTNYPQIQIKLQQLWNLNSYSNLEKLVFDD